VTSDRTAPTVAGKSWTAEDSDVFRLAYDLSLVVHRASLEFPKIEQYSGLADQLRRASKSSCSLIVEGVGRQTASSNEFARYLTMAIGSAEEAKLWCRYASDLGYLDVRTAMDWRNCYGQILRMLMKLRVSVQQRSDH
jgi:four helix bundle protein